jgi:hypothetical protein
MTTHEPYNISRDHVLNFLADLPQRLDDVRVIHVLWTLMQLLKCYRAFEDIKPAFQRAVLQCAWKINDIPQRPPKRQKAVAPFHRNSTATLPLEIWAEALRVAEMLCTLYKRPQQPGCGSLLTVSELQMLLELVRQAAVGDQDLDFLQKLRERMAANLSSFEESRRLLLWAYKEVEARRGTNEKLVSYAKALVVQGLNKDMLGLTVNFNAPSDPESSTIQKAAAFFGLDIPFSPTTDSTQCRQLTRVGQK